MNFIKIKFNNNFEEEFQKAIDEVFHLVSPVFRQHECIWMPHIDVYESPDEIIILADLAGINKEELHIELNRKKIKIAGVRKMISVVKNARYCLAEIPTVIFPEILFYRQR
jgi:HSP20 family protein